MDSCARPRSQASKAARTESRRSDIVPFSNPTILPVSGLDLSLTIVILVGVGVLLNLSEALGWAFGGLTIPGYISSILAAVCGVVWTRAPFRGQDAGPSGHPHPAPTVEGWHGPGLISVRVVCVYVAPRVSDPVGQRGFAGVPAARTRPPGRAGAADLGS